MKPNGVHYRQIVRLQYHRDEHEMVLDIAYTKSSETNQYIDLFIHWSSVTYSENRKYILICEFS